MGTHLRYPVPAGTHRISDTIRKSRFVTTIGRAPDADAAKAFVQKIRREFPDARHHCFAFVAGPPVEGTEAGMSDDGEPRGTAGRPMLEVLRGCGVGEIAAVVSRWFGGTRLGTGGLVRAYAGGVKSALATLPCTERCPSVGLTLSVGYDRLQTVLYRLRQLDIEPLESGYAEGVDLVLQVPLDRQEALQDAFQADIGAGQVTIRSSGTGGPEDRPAVVDPGEESAH